MKLNKIALILSLISLGTHAYETCEFGKEIRLLDRNKLDKLKKENYLAFSDDISPESLFSSPPDHILTLNLRLKRLRSYFHTHQFA